MLVLNVKLALMAFIFIPFAVVITYLFRKNIHRRFHLQWKKYDDLNSNLQDVLSGMRVVKSYGKEQEEQKKFRQIQTVKNSCSKYRDLFIEQYSKSTKTGAGNTFYLTYFLDKELEKFTETFLRTIEKNHLLNKTGDNFEDTLDIDFENAYDDLEKQISLAQSYFKLDGNSLLTVSSSLQKTFKEDLKNAIQSILRDSIDRQIEINDAYTEYQNVLKDLAQKYFPEIESEELVLKGVRI